MSTELLLHPVPTASSTRAAPTPPRLDMYAAIHKALRLAMTDTLVQLGSLDVTDTARRAEVIRQVLALCTLCRSHVAKENDYVHPAIEACRPGGSVRIATEHEEHLVAIDAIESAAVVFEAAPSAALAHRLYRQLAGFVAENLEHMEVEESMHHALLWSGYTDAELMQIHDDILAAHTPQDIATVMHWMLPALSPAERADMFGAMRAKAPPPAFEGLLQLAQDRLPRADWVKLSAALQLG